MADRTPLVRSLQIDRDAVDQLDRILRQANRLTKKQLSKIRGSNRLTDKVTILQGQAVRAAAKQYIGLGWYDVENVIRNGQGAAAAAASRVVSAQQDTVRRVVASTELRKLISDNEALRAAATAETVLARLTGSQLPLSTRVYNTKALVFGSVDKTINIALAQGASWSTLAGRVSQFIDPATPGGASYAAKRLARTEINNAFHFSTVDRYQKSGIVELVDWNLSGSHDEDDICDKLRREGPYKLDEVPEKPHPQCFCYITPHLPTPEDFLNGLFAGDYDDDPQEQTSIGSVVKQAGGALLGIAANRAIERGTIAIEARASAASAPIGELPASAVIDLGELTATIYDASTAQGKRAIASAMKRIAANDMSNADKQTALVRALEAIAKQGALPPGVTGKGLANG